MIREQMSMEKATGLSVAAHLVFFLLAVIITSSHSSRDIDVYTVRIMSSSPKQISAKPETHEKASAQNRQKVPPAKKTPPKDSPMLMDEPAPVKVNNKALALKKARLEEARQNQIRLDDQRQLKEMQEAELLKELKIQDIKQKAKLDSIRQRAAEAGTKGGEDISESQRNKTLADYGQQIQAIIHEQWVYALADRNRELMTKVSVTVRSSGMLDINRVVEPSGDRAFDLSALKAIRKTKQVERPPFGKDEELILNFYPDN